MSGVITPAYVTESTSGGTLSNVTLATGFAPAASVPYLCVVANCAISASVGPAVIPTVGGTTGLVWGQLATINFAASPTFRRITVFGACVNNAGSLSSGTVTAAYSENQASTGSQIFSLAGADATENATALLGQAAGAGDSGGTLVGTYQPTIPDAFDDPDDILMAFFSQNLDRKVNPHSDTPGLTELRETTLTGSKVIDLMTAWNDGQLLNPKVQVRDTTDTSNSTSRMGYILLEIKAAATPPVVSTGTGMRLGMRLG